MIIINTERVTLKMNINILIKSYKVFVFIKIIEV